MSTPKQKASSPTPQQPHHRPTTGYSMFSPNFQLTNLRTATSATNANVVRSFLSPNTGTPATSPRKSSAQRQQQRAFVSSNTRPVTAPHSGRIQSTGIRTRTPSPQQQQQRPKTPRRGNAPPDPLAIHAAQRPVRTPQSTPRPRTISTLLPPRKISSLSSTTIADDDDDGGDEKADGGEGTTTPQVTPVKIQSLHFASSYTPHKCHWVRKALENLGGDWVREGRITNQILQSEEFEEKMGVLYDLAMARKHEAIDRLVSEEIEMAGRGGGVIGGGGRRKKKSKSGAGGGDKEKKREVQRNFPFAEHITGQVKESMSEALLRIMMRGDETKTTPATTTTKTKKGRRETNATPKSCSPKKKEKEDTSASSNSFEKSLKKRKRSLVQCYVIDGKLVVGTKDLLLSVGGSFVNKFGQSGQSRARRNPSTAPEKTYFRQTANMMGFLPHEVTIRYCKNSRQLIVSGARPKRDGENARQVRETIEIPKDIDIFSGLVVLRTSRGSLIFEEEEYVVVELDCCGNKNGGAGDNKESLVPMCKV